MPTPKRRAVIVAHPDDETIFFSGLIQHKRSQPWTLVCVTDGNADGAGTERLKQFDQAARALGAKETIKLNFPDLYEKRIQIFRLVDELKRLPQFTEVFTHNAIGEYGHPHHQDVSLAVHKAYSQSTKVWSTAYNCAPKTKIVYTPKMLKVKEKILSEIYFSEMSRLIHFLPCTSFEGYVSVNVEEVEAIYDFFLDHRAIDSKKLKAFKWYEPFLESQKTALKRRPF